MKFVSECLSSSGEDVFMLFAMLGMTCISYMRVVSRPGGVLQYPARPPLLWLWRAQPAIRSMSGNCINTQSGRVT
ncbi:MAG: hypothetical protein ACXWXT_09210 [Candidatus Binatia bacterium]